MTINIWLFLLIQLGFLILIGLFLYVRSLYIRNKKLQGIVSQQDKYLNEMYDVISMTERKIKEIDHNGLFQGDDDVGFFFTALKGLQETLTEYIKLIK